MFVECTVFIVLLFSVLSFSLLNFFRSLFSVLVTEAECSRQCNNVQDPTRTMATRAGSVVPVSRCTCVVLSLDQTNGKYMFQHKIIMCFKEKRNLNRMNRLLHNKYLYFEYVTLFKLPKCLVLGETVGTS